MSLRLFVYYCALIGGWAAFVAWALGQTVAPTYESFTTGWIRNALLGLSLGFWVVAFGLGFIDGVWNLSTRRLGAIFVRVAVACAIAGIGGLLGGSVGFLLLYLNESKLGSNSFLFALFFVFGWTLTGILVGVSIGAFELLTGVMQGKNVANGVKKCIKCTVGGALGGLLGGVLALILQFVLLTIFSNRVPGSLWSPTAGGFVAIGLLIGLLVAMAQVILKEAWVKVEAGFRPGREMIIATDSITIGRAEGTDIALFGDNGVEKLHARIVCDGGRYFLVDNDGTPAGTTLVNDQPIRGKTPLSSGDLIKLGNKSLLRFSEKQKRN